MKGQLRFMLTIYVAALVGCLAGCGQTASQDGFITPGSEALSETTNVSSPALGMVAEDGAEKAASFSEQFKPYAQFGMTYDAGKNELYYNGKSVRWFEDYYPISGDGAQAGIDFFNENGIVDVYAVRDLSSFVRNDDGSFDPSGKLTDLKEFSEEEFAARDIEAIKNPQPVTLISGDRMLTATELEDIAKEYEVFDVTYDAEDDQWYFNSEKVRIFRDVLTSNGESLTNGKFKGTMRIFSGNGTIDIHTVRDFSNLDASGNGTLTGIEKYSQEEFDEHTRTSNTSQFSFGTCVVIQE